MFALIELFCATYSTLLGAALSNPPVPLLICASLIAVRGETRRTKVLPPIFETRLSIGASLVYAQLSFHSLAAPSHSFRAFGLQR